MCAPSAIRPPLLVSAASLKGSGDLQKEKLDANLKRVFGSAMKLSSAIVDIIVEQIELKTKNALQIETEKAKLAQMAASNERLELLHAAKAEVRVRNFNTSN